MQFFLFFLFLAIRNLVLVFLFVLVLSRDFQRGGIILAGFSACRFLASLLCFLLLELRNLKTEGEEKANRISMRIAPASLEGTGHLTLFLAAASFSALTRSSSSAIMD
jgi:hypothetical protein